MRSSRRINLSFVRLGVLPPDSAAGVFFLLFGVFTFLLSCYQHPCQVSNTRTKVEMVATFIIKSEAFMREIFSNYQSSHSARSEIPASLLRRCASDLDQWCFIFGHVSEIAGKSRPRNTE